MARSRSSLQIPATRLERYDRLIATQPGIERKGASLPYTSVNGHMFSFLDETGALVLRLPSGEREAFVERHETRLHVAHGHVMKEYVDVPEAMFAETDQLRAAFAISHAYVAALKPKPTRRPR